MEGEGVGAKGRRATYLRFLFYFVTRWTLASVVHGKHLIFFFFRCFFFFVFYIS
jgi:hypothetical protein